MITPGLEQLMWNGDASFKVVSKTSHLGLGVVDDDPDSTILTSTIFQILPSNSKKIITGFNINALVERADNTPYKLSANLKILANNFISYNTIGQPNNRFQGVIANAGTSSFIDFSKDSYIVIDPNKTCRIVISIQLANNPFGSQKISPFNINDAANSFPYGMGVVQGINPILSQIGSNHFVNGEQNNLLGEPPERTFNSILDWDLNADTTGPASSNWVPAGSAISMIINLDIVEISGSDILPNLR
jgi:hypothetical protein